MYSNTVLTQNCAICAYHKIVLVDLDSVTYFYPETDPAILVLFLFIGRSKGSTCPVYVSMKSLKYKILRRVDDYLLYTFFKF